MAHRSEELLRLATGAIDKALPLLQDPVLLAARHLPPALSIYDQLGTSLLRFCEGLPMEASDRGRPGIKLAAQPLHEPAQSIHHDNASLLPVVAQLKTTFLSALCKGG